MNLSKLIISGALMGAALPGVAQVSADAERFSPLASGYLERARTMSDAGNFAGVADQLRHLDTWQVSLSPRQAEEYTFLLAEAYYGLDDAECLRLLVDFRNTYPASPLAPKAGLAIGDFYFYRAQWAEALDAYLAIDNARLNHDRRLLYDYRKALAMIRTGHYSDARPLIASLRGVPAYKDAYIFYTAYLDYINGDFKKAYAGFEKVTPGIRGLDAGYYMAQIDYSRGDYEKVIRNGNALLAKNRVDELAPEIYRITGLSYFKTHQYASARKALTQYLETTISTPEADALYALGALDYADGNYNAALRRFEDLTDREDAICQGAWLYMGQIYLKQNNPSAATLAFEKAARMNFDPEVSETALYNYATSLTRGGKVPFSSSADLLESFVSKYPDSEYTPEIEAWLATAYYNDRNFTKALEAIDAVKHPTDAMLATRQKILYELGIELISNGRSDAAIGYLQQAVALRRHDSNLAAQASLWLGDALYSLGRYSEARNAYRTFIKDDTARTNRAIGYYNLAYTEYKLKDYKSAAADFASALSAKPALASDLADDATVRRGDCLYYTGNYSEASALFDRAIAANAPDADYALYRRAILKGLAGNTQGKIADLTRLEKDYPQSRWLSQGLLSLARSYEEIGRSGPAADAYKKRLGLTTEIDLDELLRMASAMHKGGKWSDLIDVTARIRHAGGLEADELAEISLYEADAFSNLGRSSEANAIYTQLAENPTSAPGSQAAVCLAEYEIKNRDYEAARIRMEEFTDTGTPHQYWLARGFIALADAYAGLGQKTLAKEYLQSLKENYPNSNDDITRRIDTRLKKM